jgi:regulatory protein
MNQLGIASGEKDAIIHYLIEHNYVDELRYASAVTRGKFNQRKWGRLKIMFELRGKQVPETLIKQAFDTDISARNYELAIQELYLQKIKEYPDASPLIRKDKAIKFLLGKGYEYPIVEQTIKAMGDTQLTIY